MFFVRLKKQFYFPANEIEIRTKRMVVLFAGRQKYQSVFLGTQGRVLQNAHHEHTLPDGRRPTTRGRVQVRRAAQRQLSAVRRVAGRRARREGRIP